MLKSGEMRVSKQRVSKPPALLSLTVQQKPAHEPVMRPAVGGLQSSLYAEAAACKEQFPTRKPSGSYRIVSSNASGFFKLHNIILWSRGAKICAVDLPVMSFFRYR